MDDAGPEQRILGFAALQMADHVPLERSLGAEQSGDGLSFGGSLVDAVLAEDAQPGGVGCRDSLGRMCFAHRYQHDRGRITPPPPRRWPRCAPAPLRYAAPNRSLPSAPPHMLFRSGQRPVAVWELRVGRRFLPRNSRSKRDPSLRFRMIACHAEARMDYYPTSACQANPLRMTMLGSLDSVPKHLAATSSLSGHMPPAAWVTQNDEVHSALNRTPKHLRLATYRSPSTATAPKCPVLPCSCRYE